MDSQNPDAPVKNVNPLLPVVESFFEKEAPTGVSIMENLTDDQAAAILELLPPKLAAKIIKDLQVGYAAVVLEKITDEKFHDLIKAVDPQLATSLLMHMSPQKRENMMKHLSKKRKDELRERLNYPEDSIGRIMTSDFISFHKEIEAGEAIKRIRQLTQQKRYPPSYNYVVDEDNHLIGVLNMRDLMLVSPEKQLDAFMIRNVFSLHSFTPCNEATQELAKRKLFAAPVVDSEGHILGIIKVERMLQGVHDSATSDIQKMFGAGGDERAFSSILFSMRTRLPWLHVNLATAFLAASVVALFEDIISRLTVLAIFLPVVAGQGGNAGAQSLAVVMRGLVMREIPSDRISRLIIKEGVLGAVNGLIIGLVTAVIAWLWHGNPFLGVVIGLGMFFNLIFAGISGASIPLLMKRFGLDPAQSSSIILTTVTDVLGFFAFLGLAVVFQNYLI